MTDVIDYEVTGAGGADPAQPPRVPQRPELRDDVCPRRRVPARRRRRGGQGHRAVRQRQALLCRPRHRDAGPRRRPDLRPHGGHPLGPRGQAGRRQPLGTRVRGLPRHVPPVARGAQAGDRDGARGLHRGWPDAGLVLRLHRGERRRLLLRPGGEDGDPRRRVLRPPVGDEPACRQGVPLHRRPLPRGAGPRAGHGQPRRTRRRAGVDRARHGRADRADAAARARAGQEGGQQRRGRAGHAGRHGLRLRTAPRRARPQRRGRCRLAGRHGRADHA